MRDAMRDDASLAASGSGQQQKRTLNVSHGFALLGIQALKKIHREETEGKDNVRTPQPSVEQH
jgi:hypothetical protein